MQDDGCSGGVVSVWESTGWGHGRTPCAQAAGQTAEETAPGGPTRLGWRDQVHDTLGGDKRHWVMDEEQAAAAVWSGAGSAGCQQLYV